MKEFIEFEDNDIKDQVSASFDDRKEDYEANTKFLNGDHWQDGEGWPAIIEGDNKTRALSLIEQIFTSQNEIKEVISRHKSAVLGKYPEWTVTLKKALGKDETIQENEQSAIDETEAALTGWWKHQNVHDTIGEWLKNLLKGSRSLLRIYIPDGFKEGGSIKSGDIVEQLKKIRVEAVSPEMGAVIENKMTAQKAGMLSFTDDDDNEVFEISYLDEDGMTIIKNLSDEIEPDPINLGGHLSIYEGSRELLITKQVRQQQKMLNKAHTMMNQNLDNGFLERTLTNIQLPGDWEKDESGKETFVPDTDKLKFGPLKTNIFQGLQVEDDDGKTKVATPGIHFREPIDPEAFVKTKAAAYASILQETHQMHALISGDATASGESRIQALADFIMDAQATKSIVDDAGRWLIETVMYLAFDLSGDEGKVEEFKATFDCRIDPGNIPAELRDKIIKQVDEGLLSRETAMAMLGVDDVDAELAKIDSAAEQALEILQKLRDANVVSKTLSQKLVGIVIEDKQFIVDALEESDLSTINDEIAAQVDRQSQEADLTGATLGGAFN